MNWQKQGTDWKLLSRSATKLQTTSDVVIPGRCDSIELRCAIAHRRISDSVWC